MIKKPQPSTKNNSKTKRKTPIGGDDLVYAFKVIPVSESIVEEWAEELEKWVKKNPKAKTITEFIRFKGINRSTFYNLIKKHQCLADAHENAMRELGERLWGDAVDRKADWKAVQFMLHTYAPEFELANKYHSDLKKQEEEAARAYNVTMASATPPLKDK